MPLPPIFAPVPQTRKEIALKILKYLSVVAVAASGALYAAPIARQVPELITGEDNEAAGYTLATFAAFGKMVVYAVQYLSILDAISKERNNDRGRFYFLKMAGISALSVSTMLAAFLLAVIQLRESAFDYGNFQYPIALFAAFNEGIEVALSFTVLIYIWLAKQYFFDQHDEERDPIDINGDEINEETMFPGRFQTIMAVLIPFISLSVLVYCILDEYFRTLPSEIDPTTANVLSTLGTPGVLFIGLLGMGSFFQLLESRYGFRDLNVFVSFFTIIFSAAAASMEFKLGTEAARDNYVLGMVLGTLNVIGQIIITQSFMYKGLDAIKEVMTPVINTAITEMRKLAKCPPPYSPSSPLLPS